MVYYVFCYSGKPLFNLKNENFLSQQKAHHIYCIEPIYLTLEIFLLGACKLNE